MMREMIKPTLNYAPYPCMASFDLLDCFVIHVFRGYSPNSWSYQSLSGDEALAYRFLGIRPARNASRPASIALRIATAIRTGF